MEETSGNDHPPKETKCLPRVRYPPRHSNEERIAMCAKFSEFKEERPWTQEEHIIGVMQGLAAAAKLLDDG